MVYNETNKKYIYKYRQTKKGKEARKKEREKVKNNSDKKKALLEYAKKYYLLHKDEIAQKRRKARQLK